MTLLAVISNLYEKILLKRMELSIEANVLISSDKFKFRENYLSIDREITVGVWQK